MHPAPVRVGRDALLLFDGIFLFRPELVDHWDLRIYLRVTPETSLSRGVARDAETEDARRAVAQKYRERYLPGQAIYRDRVQPERLAHLIVDNDDPAKPVLRP